VAKSKCHLLRWAWALLVSLIDSKKVKTIFFVFPMKPTPPTALSLPVNGRHHRWKPAAATTVSRHCRWKNLSSSLESSHRRHWKPANGVGEDDLDSSDLGRHLQRHSKELGEARYSGAEQRQRRRFRFLAGRSRQWVGNSPP
jgi:hypothetical protein